MCVLVLGCGLIGSWLALILAKNPRIAKLVFVDPDTFDQKNAATQNVPAKSVNRNKALACASLAANVRANLQVGHFACRVQQLPLGVLRTADLLIAAVDRRSARAYINRAACLLGKPWLNVAVRADGILTEVTHYAPGAGEACFECTGLGQEAVHSCNGSQFEVAATGSTAAHGAFAAGLAAIEVHKQIEAPESVAPARRFFIDSVRQQSFAAACRQNPNCACEHAAHTVEPSGLTPRSAIGALFDESGVLEVPLNHFTTGVTCFNCHKRRGFKRPTLEVALRAGRVCAACGQHDTRTAAADFLPCLDRSKLAAADLALPLSKFGIRAGEIVITGAGRCLEIGGLL